jgi:hypothetical protein
MEATVYWVPNDRLGRIGIMSRPRGGDWLEDEIRGLRSAGVDVLVSLLTQEADLCIQNGIEFLSFAIQDRGVPNLDSDAPRFLARKAAVVHCRMGVGRSAVWAACLLAGQGVAVGQAFKLIADARGCSVPDTLEQRAWVDSYAKNADLGRAHQASHIHQSEITGVVQQRGKTGLPDAYEKTTG